jgi:hypothetical protein
MKLTEEHKENAGLVRDIVAALGIKFTTDEQQRFRDALCKKALTMAKELDLAHIRRIHEALCGVERASDAELAALSAMQARIGSHYNLRALRTMPVPAVKRPERKAVGK